MKSQKKRTPEKKPRRSKVKEAEQKDQFDSLSNDTLIDLSNYGAACETLSIESLTSLDTITLGSSTMSTITLPSISYGATSGYSGTIIGSQGTSGYSTWTTSGTSGYTLGSGIAISSATVNIDTDGIDIKEGGDIKIEGVSLKEFMTKMEQRLAILVPDPKKLEKFEALKKAYEHYKLMEKLCQEEPKEEDEC